MGNGFRFSRASPLVITLGLSLTLLLAACAEQGEQAEQAEQGSDVAVNDGASELPPLIDRDLFFGDPPITGTAISPDGRWITFVKPHNDVMNVWLKSFDAPFSDARPLTDDTRPVTGYFWTEDSRDVLYVQDKDGNENFHIYKVDLAAAVTDSRVPPATNLTPFPSTRAFIYDVPEITPRQIIVGLNDRDPSLHDVYRLHLDTGERTLLIQNDTNVSTWVTDVAGNVRLAMRQRQDAGTDILVVEDGALGRILYSCSAEETCNPVRFHNDGARVYVASNKGTDVDLIRLLLVDVASGTTIPVQSDPEGEVDLGGTLFSDATEELIGTYYVGADRVRDYFTTEEAQRNNEFLRSNLPDGVVSLAITTEDDRRGIISVKSDVNPGSTFYFDLDARTVEKLYDQRPELPSEHLADMQAIRYTARDGRDIPAYLVGPRGLEPRGLPAIILPHGGPWGRDVWGYNGLAQFLANRGYAVMMPNFRGSAGFGKAFLNAGNKAWGTGVMQHDISDAVTYLIDQGIADPKRVAIMGGSYGGYATLAGVAFTPELYAAGVSIVGPSNIITLLNSIPPYWGPVIKMFHERVGDPDNPDDRARLEAQSPFFHAKNITAPLLIIQGANDPRVKKAESDQIVTALRELKRPVEYLVAADEGHGFRGKENRLAMFAAIEAFLAKHLDGRYQSSIPPEVAVKLDAMTLDRSTVR